MYGDWLIEYTYIRIQYNMVTNGIGSLATSVHWLMMHAILMHHLVYASVNIKYIALKI